MKYVHLLITALAIICHNPAFALGLGTPASQTVLGDLLYVEMPIIGIGDLNDEDLRIGIAGNEAYEKMNIDKSPSDNNLRFAIQRTGDKTSLIITSTQVIKEPYVHFLVELVSPNGTVLKDVSLLLDTPGAK